MTWKDAVIKIGNTGVDGLHSRGSGISQAQRASLSARDIISIERDEKYRVVDPAGTTGIMRLTEWGEILYSEFLEKNAGVVKLVDTA